MVIDKDTTDELIHLLSARSTALVEGNLEFFEQILTDDFIYTNAGGKVFGKATYLEFFIKSGKMKWKTQELDDFDIRCYGNIAVIICRIMIRLLTKKKSSKVTFVQRKFLRNSQTAGGMLLVRQQRSSSDFRSGRLRQMPS